MSDDSLSIDEAEDGIQVFFDEIKEKDKLLRDAVYNLSKATSKEQRETLIKKAEAAYKGAKENISFAKDDLNDYTGNKKRTFQQELKKLEQSVSKNYADLTQIKENREPAAGNASPANSTTSTGGGGRKTTKTSSTNDVPATGKAQTKPKKIDDDEIQITNLDDDYDNGGSGSGKQMQKGHSKVDEVLSIYDKNNEMLNNMIKMGDEMIQVGTAAAEKLRSQTERMNLIQKDLDDLGDGLKRAKKEINAFMRGTACDKAVVIIFILVIIGLVLLIIGWQIAKYFCIKGATNTCIAGFKASTNTTSLFSLVGLGPSLPEAAPVGLIETTINIPTSEIPVLRDMKAIE